MKTCAAARTQRLHPAARAMAFLVGFTCAVAPMAFAADAPREVHGVGDAYAGPGVTLAWAVLRGGDEAATRVVLRIVADPKVYPTVAAVGGNPFSHEERALLPATPTAGEVELRVARTQYADFPRTELRFYAPAATLDASRPALTVFYLGVPDTTPEFVTEEALQAYLKDRIARARATKTQ